MNNFLDLAKERYSVRQYKDQEVENGKIEKILEAAKAAPTACNYQPEKIFVIKSAEKRAELAKICPCTFKAPLVFVIGYDLGISAKGLVEEDFDFGNLDSAIVCTHMMLEAWDLGLGSCWVGYFKEKEVKEVLNLGDNIKVRAILPVGYAADNAAPSALHNKSRELEEIVKEF